MLPNAIILLGLSAGSSFVLPSNVRESVVPDERDASSAAESIQIRKLLAERLALVMELTGRLHEQERIARTAKGEIKLKIHSLDFAYRKRLAELKKTVLAAPGEIKKAKARIKEAKRQLREAEGKDDTESQTLMRRAKRDLESASAKLITHTTLLEGNSKALAEERASTSAERQARMEPKLAPLRETVRAAEVEAAHIQTRLDLIERNVALEQEIFQHRREVKAITAKAMADVREMAAEGLSFHTIIKNDYLSARVTGASLALPVLVNFTAHTAVNARKMEVSVFPTTKVARQLTGFVEARLHVDVTDKALRTDIDRRVAEIAQTTSVPVYVALDPRTGEELGRFEGSTINPDDFAAFLKAASDRFDRSAEPATNSELWRRIFELEDEIHSFTSREPGSKK